MPKYCNGNIVLKNHPLDLFGKKAAEEGILRDLEKFCGFKITLEDCFPRENIEPVKVTKFQEFVKMASAGFSTPIKKREIFS